MTVQSSVTSTSSLTTGTTETESPRASSESTYQWDKPLDLSLGSSSVFSDWPMQALTLTTAATKVRCLRISCIILSWHLPWLTQRKCTLHSH